MAPRKRQKMAAERRERVRRGRRGGGEGERGEGIHVRLFGLYFESTHFGFKRKHPFII